jgi:hypothetical protein
MGVSSAILAISMVVGALVWAQSQVPFSPAWQSHAPVLFSDVTLIGTLVACLGVDLRTS